MCTSSPRCWMRRASGASAVRRRSRPQQLDDARRDRRRRRRPARPGRAARRRRSRPPGRGSPSARSARDRLEGLDVAEVVAGEDDAGGLLLGHEGRARRGPCACSPERTSMTLRPGSTTRSWRSASVGDRGQQPLEGAGRVVQPAGVDRDREPLLLDVGVARRRPGAAPTGSSRSKVASPCGGRGERIRCSVGRPALVAVLAEDEELGAAVEHRVAERVEVAQGERLAGRAAGDHRDGAHHLGQLERATPGASGCRRAASGSSTIGRERAVEVEADDDSVEDVAYGVVVGARAVGGELHGPSQSRADDDRRSGPRSRGGVRRSLRGVGGEDDREPVQLHRADGRGGALDAEVEGQLLAGGLEPRREVDRGGRDRCRTSCPRRRLPADRGGLGGGGGGQALDAGVVEDLDVDLAALDLRLRLGRPWSARPARRVGGLLGAGDGRGVDPALGGRLVAGGDEGDRRPSRRR